MKGTKLTHDDSQLASQRFGKLTGNRDGLHDRLPPRSQKAREAAYHNSDLSRRHNLACQAPISTNAFCTRDS
ncbi:hypothetical protein PUN28_015604 [Cardiocondyla obscurior]|uniref:Uncharacterized protein n=1 Tax=Cardiocondyla obscurior TaxID=286306 RepID=A0AAW2EV42_9HYME